MKIFVGFGYNPNDAWIRDLVFPLIETLGGEVLSGEEIYGQVLSDGVKAVLDTADLSLLFLTRRDQKTNGKYTTHDWVRDEYTYAINKDKKAIAIVEEMVEWNDGIAGNRQRIVFSDADKGKLMVELVKAINLWRKANESRRLLLFPPEVIEEIRPHLKAGNVKCYYRYLVGSDELQEVEAPLLRIKGGVCIDLKKVPLDYSTCVQIKVTADNKVWQSDYESIEYLTVTLKQ